MLRSHWGFANTLHSEPQEEASLRETLVYTAAQREAWVSSTVSNTNLIPSSPVTSMYLHNTAEHTGSTQKIGIRLEQIFL